MQPTPILFVVLSLAALAGPVGVCAAPPVAAVVNPLPLLVGRGGGASSAAEAAEAARRQTGGKVLSVRETSGGYEVKVLTPSGEVRMVFISGSGS
ncbi:MAG: hypothetical protein JZU52_19995 [Lamprocystis purpurea]|jgi:hypothetical protein|uniref:hypothetical protein n=1 Tax=Lamprocystis purpurea TaxID=61598 RepID=UPI00035FA25B|nr:hypothetical protein [Lamprocystis purpurea]MBV5275817.1 hypothetical protein [Lamprocystis purpurea]